MNIVLFGFMGVGKSLVGRILAEKHGLTFVDLDEEIVRRTGKPIASIFSEDGEVKFREIERKVTDDISAGDRQVIACGGGTVLNPENLSRLRRNSTMILLTAEPETILERVEVEGDKRPLLIVENRLERIHGLLSTRHPQYIRAADLVVDTSGSTPAQIAKEIMSSFREVPLT